jgi:S1-C subfamily serine protease
MRFRGIDGQLIIDGVDPGAPAARRDVHAGDIITRLNGTPLASLDRNERIEMLRGSPLALTIQRDGEVMEIELSLD